MDKELRATAYHEAGHAVARWRFGCPISRATITPENDFLGVVESENPMQHMSPDWDSSPEVETALRESIIVCFAGRLAQTRFDASSYQEFHGESDNQTAIDMLLYLGGDGEHASAISSELEVETETFLDNHWSEVELVAQALIDHRDLDGSSLTVLLEKATNEVVPISKHFSYRSDDESSWV